MMGVLPHAYKATIYGTCGVCARHQESPIHNPPEAGRVLCPFCYLSLPAMGPRVSDHLSSEHNIISVRALWTQEDLNAWSVYTADLGWRVPNDARS